MKKVVKREAPEFPTWLKGGPKDSGHVRVADIDAGRRYRESVNGNAYSQTLAKIGMGVSPTWKDEAKHTMIKMYQCIMDVMKVTRRYYPASSLNRWHTCLRIGVSMKDAVSQRTTWKCTGLLRVPNASVRTLTPWKSRTLLRCSKK